MDRTVVDDMLKNDIAKRESEVVNRMSAESRQLAGDLIKEANKHIGKPYVHGMKGPNAFDCSGFSSYVYKQFGYSISPSSRVQYTEGVKVDRKNLRTGDLVFFTSRSSGRHVGHVGIVVDANNETGDFSFIHASVKGVKISTCEGYYEGRYVGARRIITD
ncbi:MAG: C40 family peptidase [Candidatus Amulumruptor caecigallinarius]|nr:C40 family peptidase [Candidatus Amulumruptor caecigallinarius]